MFKLFLKSIFNDFFPEISCLTMLTNPPSNFYIKDCFFNNVKRAEHGAVLHYASLVIHLVIEDVTFTSCGQTSWGTSVNGGAIHFNCNNGGFVMTKVCAFNCYAGFNSGYTHNGMVAYVLTSNSKKNWILQVSAYNCPSSSTISTQNGCFYSSGGEQIFENVNLSRNYITQTSGFHSLSAFNFSSKYCTFAHSRTVNHYCVYLQNSQNTRILQTNNFVNNSSPSSYAVLHSSSNHIVENCVFTSNLNILLGGILQVSNCWIHHTSTLSTGSVIILSSTITTDGPAPTFELFHFASAFCMVPTPAPTLEPSFPPVGQEWTPAQTLPPPPTVCEFTDSSQKLLSITSVLHFLYALLFLTITFK